MSQGVMRKPQPFTVGTRLSIPKCPDLSTSGHCVAPMDSLSMPPPLRPRMLHYSPLQGGADPHHRTPPPEDEDSIHGPHKSLARSIRKIALSRHGESPQKEGALGLSPRGPPIISLGNCNNNNSRGLRQLTDPVSLDWTPPNIKSAISQAKCPACPSDHTASPAGGIYSGSRRPCADDPPQIAQLSRDISEMSDLLPRSDPPAAAAVRAQLHNLKDQWQLLKETATNQNKAVGGATALQEFIKKADELEMWMREKEEIPPLSLLLDENLDKVQLSRRILDLKQEQLYYSNLQENINSLAQKLEKHGRAECRGTSNRRKHLNRMWLRLQGSLNEYQRSLQLALEGASLWQQADTVLRAMQEKVDAAGCARVDQDFRDIAGQVMMLDVLVSQVCSLHPVLASRALHRQRQVKEVWTRLQQTVRTGKSSRGAPFTREPRRSLTPETREHSSVGKQQQSILGSQSIVSQRDPNSGEYNAPLRPTRQAGPASRREKVLQCRDEGDAARDSCQRHPPSPDTEEDGLLGELETTSQWLQNLEQLLSEPTTMRSPELVRRDLRQVSYLEKQLKSRGTALHSVGRPVRGSWRSADEEMQLRVREVEERLQTVQEALRRRASDLRDTLVLSEFMKVVQMEEEKRKRNTPLGGPSDPPPESTDRKEVFTPLEDLQEAVEMLNDAAKERERALAATKVTSDLERRLSALTKVIQSAGDLTREVQRKMDEAERDYMEVKKHTELRDLQEISALHQQAEVEVSGELEAEVRRLEEQRDRLQDLCPQRSQVLGRNIEETLQAWAQLQEDIQRNRGQLHRTSRLREFFRSYLEMISWTEETRSQILSDSPEDRLCPAWREGLERSIDNKMKEFEVLAGVGWKLIGEDRLLTQTIKERLEELQGMLSWVLMRWRCQKHPTIRGNRTQKAKDGADPAQVEGIQNALRSLQSDNLGSSVEEETTPTAPPPRGPVRRRYRRKALSPMLFQQPVRLSGGMDSEDGAELLEDVPRKCADGPLWLEPKVLPTVPRTEEPEEEEPLQVSTYLNTKEGEGPYTCQSSTVPRPSKKSRSSERFTSMATNDSDNRSSLLFRSLKRKEKAQRCTVQGIMDLNSDQKPIAKETTKYETSTWPPKLERTTPQPELGNFLHYVKNPLTTEIDDEGAEAGEEIQRTESAAAGEKIQRTEGATAGEEIQRTEGATAGEEIQRTESAAAGEERQRTESAAAGEEIQRMESATAGEEIQRMEGATFQAGLPHLTLGSVLTLEISKDAGLLDPMPESLLKVSIDDNGSGQLSDSRIRSKDTAELNTDEGDPQDTMNSSHSSSTRSWIEALTSSPGYCRQNIHNYGKLEDGSPSQDLQELNDDFINFQIDRLSPIGVLHHLECDGQRAENVSTSIYPEDNHPSTYRAVTPTIYQKALDGEDPSNDNPMNSEHPKYIDFVRTYDTKPTSIIEPHSSFNNPTKRRSKTKTKASHSFPEVLHPDQEFLEHDDKELEDIWNNARQGQLEPPKPKPHIVSLKAAEGDKPTKANRETPNQKAQSDHVVMRSEPNMLVATFKLPTSVVLSSGSGMEKDQKKDGSPGHTATLTDSNQRDQQPSVKEPHAMKTKPEAVEKAITTVSRKLDYQLMEGTLEKKHILQSGGRKASSRTWGVFYAVLVRRTLCFYHDRKHSTKSPVSAPPLHLTGALCTPESDYTKRNNCFRLRLRDGSEYLFRAPTSDLLQEWVCRLRHNSGVEDNDPLQDPAMVADRSPLLTSRGRPLRSCMPDLCHPLPARSRDMAEQRVQPHSDPAGGRRADTHQARYRDAENILKSADSEFDVAESRRRSRSFSSVLYQKMTSFPGPTGPSPSYSVTLYIDEPLAPRARCHSFASTQVTNSGSDLKLRNKSVFRKFFWKKE